ncbi:serine/threonine-protein kinase/endoribonuclease IRE1a-like protein, partial [Tanacetum coccineum]
MVNRMLVRQKTNTPCKIVFVFSVMSSLVGCTVENAISRLKVIFEQDDRCCSFSNVIGGEGWEFGEERKWGGVERWLAAFIGDNRGQLPDQPEVLRHVARAILVLHASNVLHCNIRPEHVLLRTTPYGDYTIKLCGLGQSRSCKPSNFQNTSSDYMLERQTFTELILAFMTRGSHKCASTESPIGYTYQPYGKNKYEDEMKEPGMVIARDLVRKLMDKEYMITFSTVCNHLLFWNWYDQISFLKDASDEIFAKKLSGIEREASKFFTDNWESKIDENKNAKMWFSLMKEVPEKTKEEVQESKEMEEVHEKRVRGRGGRDDGGRDDKAK